jgi:hypothetical protein
MSSSRSSARPLIERETARRILGCQRHASVRPLVIF